MVIPLLPFKILRIFGNFFLERFLQKNSYDVVLVRVIYRVVLVFDITT